MLSFWIKVLIELIYAFWLRNPLVKKGWSIQPINSDNIQYLKSKCNFWNSLLSFWSFGCKDVLQVQRDIPLKSFWKPWIFSPSLNFQERIPKLDWSCDVTGRVKIIQYFLFRGSSGWGNRFRVSKNFLGDIFLYVWNIFATAAPK